MGVIYDFLLEKYQIHLDYFKKGEAEKFRDFYTESDAIEQQIEFYEKRIAEIKTKYQESRLL